MQYYRLHQDGPEVQDILDRSETIDPIPVLGSHHLVESGGVYEALSKIKQRYVLKMKNRSPTDEFEATVEGISSLHCGDLFDMLLTTSSVSSSVTLKINDLNPRSILRLCPTPASNKYADVSDAAFYTRGSKLRLLYDGTCFVLIDFPKPYGGNDFEKPVDVSKGGTGKSQWDKNVFLRTSSDGTSIEGAAPLVGDDKKRILTVQGNGDPYWDIFPDIDVEEIRRVLDEVIRRTEHIPETIVGSISVGGTVLPMEGNNVSLPVASNTCLGLVKASSEISVSDEGALKVNELNIMKIVQTDSDELLLCGGGSF